MSLFGGRFATGLAEGLATSIDTSLRDAMEKRDEEMTRVKKFQMERQAQKQDEAEKEDKRIEAAYDQLVQEFKGDEAKAYAAFNAIGGGIDGVETYLKDVADTRATADPKYSIVDKFKFDGIDFEGVGEVDRTRALEGLRTEIKPVDVQMVDTGLLSKIGLGKEDMGADVSAEVNELIPARERNAIKGLIGGAVDRTGLLTNERYKAEKLAAIPDLDKQVKNNIYMMMRGKDLEGNELGDAGMIKLERENARLIAAISRVERAKDPSGAGPSASQVASAYSSRLSQLEKDTALKISPEGIVTAQNGNLEGDSAMSFYQGEKDKMQDDFVRTSVLNEEGEFLSSDAQFQAEALGLGDAIDRIREEIGAGKADEAAPAGPTQEEATAQALEKYPTPNDMANAESILAGVDSAAELHKILNTYYPNVDRNELSAIAIRAFQNKPEPEDRSFNPNALDPQGGGSDSAETDVGETEVDVPDTPVDAARALRKAETMEEYERLLPIYMQLTGREEDDVKRSFPPPAN